MASHLMIDIEGLATGPDATILTIAAQSFDPFGHGYSDRYYYCRVDLESQENRAIEDGTVAWWGTQPEEAQKEALGDGPDRVDLKTALEGLYKIAWQHDFIWAQGPTYDCNILEHAFKSLGMALPWKFYRVRDSRTVISLWPGCPKPPTTHHALEDVRKQIDLLQKTLNHLGVSDIR